MSNFLVIQPTRGTLFTKVQESIEREFRDNKQYPAIIRTSNLKLIPARNYLVDTAVETEADIIVFCDDDVVLPEGAFKAFENKLITSDITVIDYPHHHHPLLSDTKPTGVTVFTQWLPNEDIYTKPIAWSGLGAVAMKRTKLKELMDKVNPLFSNTAHPVGVDTLGRVGLTPTRDNGLAGQSNTYSGGEDTDFFLNARKHGFSIGLVKDLKGIHLRLDHAVSWVSDDKYTSVHKIEESTEIVQPGNALHMDLNTIK